LFCFSAASIKKGALNFETTCRKTVLAMFEVFNDRNRLTVAQDLKIPKIWNNNEKGSFLQALLICFLFATL